MCRILCKLSSKYIVWPTNTKLANTARAFNKLRKHFFPNVIGCIDGSHIPIRGPTNDNSYYNRKGYHSMILQGICNSKLEFIDIFCGWPGSAHDARVWQNSPIYNKLKEDNILPEKYHLLGDSAYPLDNFIMVPFKDNGHLTERQKMFNRRLCSSRVVIEQTFGILKEVFRRLKYLNLLNLNYFKYIVTAACVLHNYRIKRNIFYDNMII